MVLESKVAMTKLGLIAMVSRVRIAEHGQPAWGDALRYLRSMRPAVSMKHTNSRRDGKDLGSNVLAWRRMAHANAYVWWVSPSSSSCAVAFSICRECVHCIMRSTELTMALVTHRAINNTHASRAPSRWALFVV